MYRIAGFVVASRSGAPIEIDGLLVDTPDLHFVRLRRVTKGPLVAAGLRKGAGATGDGVAGLVTCMERAFRE